MNLENLEVKLKEEYPEIENAKEDKTTVCLLKNLISSRLGELTGILQYAYQSTIASKTNSEIAEAFEEISIVEMIHLRLLMQAITMFGGVPKYEDCQGLNFNAGYVYTSTKLKDMLEANIVAERKGIEEYENAILKVKNESLKNLLKRIIKDEELHIKILTQIKNNVEFLSI